MAAPPVHVEPATRARRGDGNVREQLTTGGVIASVLALGTAAGARVVDADLREGPLWAVAGAIRSIHPGAAIACVLLAVGASLGVVQLLPRSDQWTRGFVVAAVTAAAMTPSLLTVSALVDESKLFVPSAAMSFVAASAAAATVIADRWHRTRARLLVAASVVAAMSVSAAAAFDDNSDRPVPAWLAVAIFLLPLLIGVTARVTTGTIDRLIRAVVVLGHGVGMVFVISAATSCVDDDCIPVPLWFLGGSLAIVWATAAHVTPGPPTGEPTDPSEPDDAPPHHIATAPEFPDAGLWALAAPLGFLAIAAGVAGFADPDRDPPSFGEAEPELITQLPAMLAWDDDAGCVVIAGVADLTNHRTACRAEFVEWVQPSSLLVIKERSRSNSLFDPVTLDRNPRSWDFVPNIAEPPIKLRLETPDRGRVEVWVDAEDGTSRRLLAEQGGHSYELRGGGLSPDGALAAVVDSAGRLLLVPTDATRDPVTLASGVRRFGGWEPEFGPAVTEFALEQRVPLRMPSGVEVERDFYDAHREFEAAIEPAVIADLVVVGDEVHVRFTGSPTADLPDGFCVAVTSFFESSPADRAYSSIDIAGPVPFCDASSGQLTADCSQPTVPTLATVDDLERFEALVVEAELIAPWTWDSVPNEISYFQLSTSQVTGGAVNPDDLPRLDDVCS